MTEVRFCPPRLSCVLTSHPSANLDAPPPLAFPNHKLKLLKRIARDFRYLFSKPSTSASGPRDEFVGAINPLPLPSPTDPTMPLFPEPTPPQGGVKRDRRGRPRGPSKNSLKERLKAFSTPTALNGTKEADSRWHPESGDL